MVANAKKRKATTKRSVTDSSRLKGIRQNRATEKELERNRSRIKSNTQPTREHSADIVPFHSNKTESNENLDYPDLDSFLEDDDD